LSPDDLQRRFNELSHEYSAKINLKLNQKGNDNELRFIRDLNRHFTVEVSTRIKFAVMAISELRNKEDVA